MVSHCIVAAMKAGLKRFLKDTQAVMDAWMCSFVDQLGDEMRVQEEKWITEIAASGFLFIGKPDSILIPIPVDNGSHPEGVIHQF